jgi:hypothetical protein
MEKLLKDCIMWDVASILPLNSSFSANNSAIAPAVDTQLSASPSKARSTIIHRGSVAVTGTAAGGQRKSVISAPLSTKITAAVLQETAPAITPLMFSQCRMTLGANPELTYLVAKRLFTAYQAPANLLIAKISENPRYAQDPEVSRRIQATRIMLLSLSELFSQINAENSAEYHSFKLYAYELTSVDRFCEDSSNRAARIQDEFSQNEYLTLNTVRHVRSMRNDSMAACTHSWALLQSFLTMLSELAISAGEDCPRDAWQVGVKMHVDRSFVYNIHTKNSLTN